MRTVQVADLLRSYSGDWRVKLLKKWGQLPTYFPNHNSHSFGNLRKQICFMERNGQYQCHITLHMFAINTQNLWKRIRILFLWIVIFWCYLPSKKDQQINAHFIPTKKPLMTLLANFLCIRQLLILDLRGSTFNRGRYTGREFTDRK